MSTKTVVEFTDNNFQSLALESDKVVLVDFWAVWCGPCKMIKPIIEELANEYEGKAVIGQLDVGPNPVTGSNYGIISIPTLLYIKNGKVVDKLVGAAPKSVIQGKLDAAMAN